MKITREDFNRFWSATGRYLRIKNAERLHKNLAKKIDELKDTVKLDDYVCAARTGKESTRQIVVKFYEYLSAHDCRPESVLYEKKFYDYPFERQLEIAKFLHTEKTLEEIEERFDINEQTRRKDLQELEEGITVLGSTIKVDKEKKGRKYYYRTTVHPIFLPLNLTEVYALTVYLNRVIKNHDANAMIIRDISGRIKSQLSDYALDKLFPGENHEDLRRKENKYLDDEELAGRREGIRGYLMKSGQPCKFIWQGEEYLGTIKFNHETGLYYICLDNGECLDANLDEVDFITDSLIYK